MIFEIPIIFGKRTRKGNVYLKEDLERAIKEFKEKESVRGEYAFNLSRHNKNYASRALEIDIKNTSHIINDLYIEDDKLYCDIELLDTPKSKLTKEYIDDLVFFPRMFGKRDEKGKITSIKILTVDSYAKWELSNIY